MLPAVQISGLRKSYLSGTRFWRSREQYEALLGIDCEIAAGEIFGLVGRNGYGKTTLIKCVAGLISPSSGSVRVFGLDTVKDGGAVRKLIGWVGAEERSFYLRLTSRQNLMFFARLQGMDDGKATARIEQLCLELGCDQYLERRMHELSTGNRQRISIVRGLLHNPKLLILDEPTRSLDPFAASELRRLLVDWVGQTDSRSILITSHHLGEIQNMSHRIGIMGKGRLGICGTLEQLRRELGAAQNVKIFTRRAVKADELDQLRQDAGTEIVMADDARSFSFSRPDAGADHCLELMISKLLSFGIGIKTINTTEVELQDLIDALEHRGT